MSDKRKNGAVEPDQRVGAKKKRTKGKRPVKPVESVDGKAVDRAEASGGKAAPIDADETYGDLHDQGRVVMRHQIALNIENFRAAPEEFVPRPKHEYGPLAVSIPPFLSVIIPNYNGAALLPTVLASLQAQTFADFEVIVIDDASTDDSVAWVERHHPEARLVVNRTNEGFAASCNRAASVARGRLLVLLNSDTEPDTGWLAALAVAVCAHPNAAIFASKMLLFDERDRLHTAGDTLGVDGVPRNRGVWEQDAGQYDEKIAIFAGSGCGVAYRKEVWDSLGGFDVDYWMYLEDVDFAFRTQLFGWDAVFVPNARVYHRISATGGDVLASYYVGRNTIWNIVKNMPRGLLVRNGIWIIMSQLDIALDALRYIRGAAARARLRGQLAAIVGLREPLQKRAVIQARRLVENSTLASRLEKS